MGGKVDSRFNETKYLELLERLEAVELNKSYVLKENKYFRIDDEFFNKKYLKTLNLIETKPFNSLISLSNLITDFGAFSQMNFVNYIDKGIPFLRNQDVKENSIDIDNCVYVDHNVYKRLSLKLEENDILIPRAGTLGNAAVVNKSILPATANQNLAQIKPNTELIKPYFLTTFLCSKFGLNQIERVSTGNVQQWLNLENINNIKIPKFSNGFQTNIEKRIILSNNFKEKSKHTYTQAETILLREIGLKKETTSLNPVEVTNTNVKSFKESFGVTGRLDAEYYQKKYEAIIETIKSQKYDTLQRIVEVNKSIEPGSNYYSDDETGLPFMRVADYNKFGLSEPNKKLTLAFVKDNHDKINDLKPKKGTILFSKDGSVGTAYHLREDFNGVTSSAILHLKVRNEKEVIPEYLALALNSKLVQMQAERDAGGSIILHWRVGEIQNVVVPIIDYTKQHKIAKLIEESFLLKKQSEHLLEVAKKAVEIAIEESEDVAIKFINENT